MEQLNKLTAGMAVLVGGDHIVRVSADLAAAFAAGYAAGIEKGAGRIAHPVESAGGIGVLFRRFYRAA